MALRRCFGLICVGLQVFLQYARYVAVLKWLTLALFAYFGTMLTGGGGGGGGGGVAGADMAELERLPLPRCGGARHHVISPYLFFWQRHVPGSRRPARAAYAASSSPRRLEQAPAAFERIGLDTWIGMALSNLVALAIMLTAGATLHVAGKTGYR